MSHTQIAELRQRNQQHTFALARLATECRVAFERDGDAAAYNRSMAEIATIRTKLVDELVALDRAESLDRVLPGGAR